MPSKSEAVSEFHLLPVVWMNVQTVEMHGVGVISSLAVYPIRGISPWGLSHYESYHPYNAQASRSPLEAVQQRVWCVCVCARNDKYIVFRKKTRLYKWITKC